MDQVLERLFHYLNPLDIRVKVLLLDRGFYSIKVIRSLMGNKLMESPEVEGPSTHLHQSTLDYLVNQGTPDKNPWRQDLS